uniref:Uncharacterized protein n=1 Tax=Chondria sp. (in: red algae) TaxID=1982705 RepID=A0A1Z1ME18_9FLOR|nr:hypothetical protein [Chondria sp. (in: red algae)]
MYFSKRISKSQLFISWCMDIDYKYIKYGIFRCNKLILINIFYHTKCNITDFISMLLFN